MVFQTFIKSNTNLHQEVQDSNPRKPRTVPELLHTYTHALPGIDGLSPAVAQDGSRGWVERLVLQQVPLQSVEGVILVLRDGCGQGLAQQPSLQLEKTQRHRVVLYVVCV